MTMNITMYRISLEVRVFHVRRTLLSIVVERVCDDTYPTNGMSVFSVPPDQVKKKMRLS